MLERPERRSIAALYAFKNYADDYLLIGEHLKVKQKYQDDIRTLSDDSIVKMHRMFLVHFKAKDQENNHSILELEIITALKKAVSSYHENDIEGFLDLSKESHLQILGDLPFLKDDDFKRDMSEKPVYMDMLKRLKKNSSDWYMIGLMLGVPAGILKGLSLSLDDNTSKLETCDDEWLKTYSTHPHVKSVDVVFKMLKEFDL